jgi:nitrite reductase (NADH) small subunit
MTGVVKIQHGRVAVFRSSETDLFAIEDRCPMQNWGISLVTGEAQGADEGRVATIPLESVDGRILLDLTALAAARAA